MRRAVSSTRLRIVLGVLAVLVLGWSGSAAAEKKRVGVPRFDGPQEAIIRKAVMQVAQGRRLRRRRREGDRRRREEHGRAARLERRVQGRRQGAGDLGVRHGRGRRRRRPSSRCATALDGSVSGEGSFGGANPNKIAADVRDGFGRRLGSAVERGRAPAGAKKPHGRRPSPRREEAEDEGAARPVAATRTPPPKPETSRARRPRPPRERARPRRRRRAAAAGPRRPSRGRRRARPRASAGRHGSARARHRRRLRRLQPQPLVQPGPLRHAAPVQADARARSSTSRLLVFPAAFGVGRLHRRTSALEANIEQAFGVLVERAGERARGPSPWARPSARSSTTTTAACACASCSPGGHELAVLRRRGRARLLVPRRSGHDGRPREAQHPGHDLPLPPRRRRRALRAAVGHDGWACSAAYRYVLNQAGDQARHNPTATVGLLPLPHRRGHRRQRHARVPRHAVDRGALQRQRAAVLLRHELRRCPDDFLRSNTPNSIAGGATDQYVGFTIGAAYIFGGVAPGTVVEQRRACRRGGARAQEAQEKEEEVGTTRTRARVAATRAGGVSDSDE